MYIPEELQPYIQMYYLECKRLHETDPFMTEKFQFQNDNPNMKNWTDTILAPSLLNAQEGMQACIDSINNEADDFLKLCKFIYTYKVWDQFGDADSYEVALDLATQGYTSNTLAVSIRRMLFNEIDAEYINKLKEVVADELGFDSSEVSELVQNNQTFH